MNARRLLAFAHDLVAAGLAWLAAFWLRFNLEVPTEYLDVALTRLPWVIAVYAATFLAAGLYRGLWRFASLPDLQRIVIAVGLGTLAVAAALAFFRIGAPVPRSAYLITPLLLVAAMGGSRLAYRAWKERRLFAVVRHPDAMPVLVLGAGVAASMLLRDLANSSQWRVAGLLDDDRAKHGAALMGVKVLGPLERVGEVAARLGVTQAIVAMPGATHGARKRAVELCTQAGVAVMTVPALGDIVSGRVSVSAVRKVELDDLLGRDPVALDTAGLHGFLDGKTVLVTGAGGSIGAELTRQIARFAPARIVLLDVSEFALYTIEQEFRDRLPGVPVAAAIGPSSSPSTAAISRCRRST